MSSSAFFFLCVALLLAHVNACEDFRLLYENCEKSTDCVQYSPLLPTVCNGRDRFGEVKDCVTGEVVDQCVCRTTEPHVCDDNRDCPDLEFCGTSRKSGRNICLGCLSRQNEVFKEAFQPVNETDTNTRCPTSRPPCGHAEDHCSLTMQCDKDYTCLSFVAFQPFNCAWESTSCQCFTRTSDDKVKEQLCQTDDNCQDRELCALNTLTSKKTCVSCDAQRNSFHLKSIDESSEKCENLELKRPLPSSYVEGPNGRALDRCISSKQCTLGARCIKEVFKGNNITYAKCDTVKELCYCRPDKLHRCSDGKDCKTGESCMTVDRYQVNKNCVSNALFDALSANQYKVVGDRKRSPTNGTKLNGDKCRFDWDCQPPRRCTHRGDTYKADSYGKCAGRDACQCTALTSPPCFSHSECADGERCVTAIDAKFNAFCLSEEVFNSSNDFVSFDSNLLSSASPSPRALEYTGLSEEPCSKDDECISDDKTERFCFYKYEAPNEHATHCQGDRRNCICKVPFETDRNNGLCNITKSDPGCPSGEACTMFRDEVPSEIGRCVSQRILDDGALPYNVGSGDPPTVQPPVDSTGGPEPDNTPNSAMTESASPSKTPSASGSPSCSPPSETTNEPVCIDAKLLSSFKRSELVFPKHIRAAVLCDASGSCATPGHMVIYKGSAMSMKSYCNEHAKCSRRVTWVNSPRMSSGLRVTTVTSELKMTAFAARYESWLEEAVLRQIINIGA